MTNKYKPQGWFNDSHRHSLAAKGIPTRYNASKYHMAMQQPMMQDSMMQEPMDDSMFIQSQSNPVKDDVTDIPQEVMLDMRQVDSFRLTDAAVLPGALVKDAGSAIADMMRFGSEVTKR